MHISTLGMQKSTLGMYKLTFICIDRHNYGIALLSAKSESDEDCMLSNVLFLPIHITYSLRHIIEYKNIINCKIKKNYLSSAIVAYGVPLGPSHF